MKKNKLFKMTDYLFEKYKDNINSNTLIIKNYKIEREYNYYIKSFDEELEYKYNVCKILENNELSDFSSSIDKYDSVEVINNTNFFRTIENEYNTLKQKEELENALVVKNKENKIKI